MVIAEGVCLLGFDVKCAHDSVAGDDWHDQLRAGGSAVQKRWSRAVLLRHCTDGFSKLFGIASF